MKTTIYSTNDHAVSICRVDDLLLIANWPGNTFPDDSWRDYIRLQTELLADFDKEFVALTFSPKGAPNAHQRREVNAHFKQLRLDHMRRMALLSDSALVRGAVTAISWLTRAAAPVKGFMPRDYGHALRWLSPGFTFDVNEAVAVLGELVTVTGNAPLAPIAPSSR